MTKNLTKLWVGGLHRLFAFQKQAAGTMAKHADFRPPEPLRPARTARRAATAAASANTSSPGVGAVPRESRVRPRAAAWAAGDWRRSVHLAPATPARPERALPYGLYVPPGRTTVRMPLVVMLHGCKQTVETFAEGTRMNLLADLHGFAVVYPEQPEHVHAHGCWHWYDARDLAGGGEAAAVVSLVDELVAEYGFDGARVYVAGLSAGAGLAALLAVRAPQRFAAVALHSGPVFGEAHSGITAMDVMRRGTRHDPVALVDREIGSACPGMPAIIVQGDDDRVVAPVNAGQLTMQFLRLNGLADARGVRPEAEMREERQPGYVTRDYRRGGKTVVESCSVAGLGHAWSGGDGAVPFHSSSGPDASAMIWRFFESQSRAASDGVDRRVAADA